MMLDAEQELAELAQAIADPDVPGRTLADIADELHLMTVRVLRETLAAVRGESR